MVRLIAILLLLPFVSNGKVKFIIEDFEGCSREPGDLNRIGVFTFGSAGIKASQSRCTGKGYSGRTALELFPAGDGNYAGWGIGVGRFIDIDQARDRFNFIYQSKESQEVSIKIILQDDDNFDNQFTDAGDDRWVYSVILQPGEEWKVSSVALSDFKDDTKGGDGQFNMGYRTGKLLNVLFRAESKKAPSMLFDFICLSSGSFHVVNADSTYSSGCAIGAWDEEGQRNPMFDIAAGFTRCTRSEPNIAVVHSFHPFSDDGGSLANKFPNVAELNKVVSSGLVPMITIENQFLGLKSKKQPSLKAVADGKFDGYFYECAKRFKKVNGKVLVRLMHEFNGNWYPWCIANNGNDPALYVAAYRRIVKIFREIGVPNVYFVWCVNSISIPQATWNNVVDAYPGDDVVDIVGTDIYNGAEKGQFIWRSFRKEAAETYYQLTSNFPSKPVMICEFSSREKLKNEGKDAPGKADWIREASEAIRTDFSGFFIASWFNAGKYRINTSEESRKAFVSYMVQDRVFKEPHKIIETKLKR